MVTSTKILLVIGIIFTFHTTITFAKSLRIGAFNIKLFGKAKIGKPDVVEQLVQILNRYDLVLIQEIRDKSGTAIVELIQSLNSYSSDEYSMIISSRVGRTSSKEQYAYFYKSYYFEVTDSYEYDDGDEELQVDTFEREPFIVRFKCPWTIVKDFAVVGVHTKPTKAFDEIDSLADVYDDITNKWGLKDVIIAGDLNAGCTYVRDWKDNRLKNKRFTWLIDDDADTNVSPSQCAYDRFVIAGELLAKSIKPCSATIFYFSAIYALEYDLTKDVSDHFPIEFQLLEDTKLLEEAETRFLEDLLDEFP
ncbi:deoxyribonuclease-1-like [Antedon mediterranea]|uniref:deoxyribonuclease-1-like n=1 Tax=Antedon mediterranea TaxID=105859 RepID=UPI003AF5EB1E